jgi:hypothetical protein
MTALGATFVHPFIAEDFPHLPRGERRIGRRFTSASES